MAQVDQAPPLNEHSTNGNHNNIEMEPMDLSSIPNGTPTKSNGCSSSASNPEENPQLSPASLRRRSTRASALKAQEKIKLKEDVVQDASQQQQQQQHQIEDVDMDDDSISVSAPKKRKLDDGKAMDQFSHRFGLRVTDGDVYAMTDESEMSSLHDSEVEFLRASYDKFLKAELTDEQKRERILMIKQCESELRLEEAKLALLHKVKNSQLASVQKASELKKIAVPSNSSGTAYKPVVAPPLNKTPSTPTATSVNGKQNAKSSNPLLAIAGMTPQQQQEFVQRLSQNPQLAAQALLASKGAGSQQTVLLAQFISQIQTAQKEKEQQQNNGVNTAAAQQAKLFAQQTPAQRAAAARSAFRGQADKQLMQISGPKAPPPDMFFIPNGNQPDFPYLLGLDLVVQRVLKDKSVHRRVTEPCYECEECGADFTTSWKAIGSSQDDLHLYCEACVRSAQKRKIRNDHTGLLKKAFSKISAQDKEFEKQIADGKLDAALVAAAAAADASKQASAATSSASMPSTSSAVNTFRVNSNVATSSGSSTPILTKSSTPIPSTSSKPSTSSTPQAKKNPTASMTPQQQMSQLLLQQIMQQNPMAASMFAQNMNNMPAMAQQMMQMQQLWSNPAAMAMSQRMSQPNPAMALMALMQQAQQQHQQQQQQQSNQAAASNSAQAAQLANFMSMMANPAAAQMMNPNMARMLRGMTPAQQRQFVEQAFKSVKK